MPRTEVGLESDPGPIAELEPTGGGSAAQAAEILTLRATLPPAPDDRELRILSFDRTGRWAAGLLWSPRPTGTTTRFHGWDLEGGALAFSLDVDHRILDLAPGNGRYATAEDGAVRFRDAATGQVSGEIPVSGWADCVALDEDAGVVLAADVRAGLLAAWTTAGDLLWGIPGGRGCQLLRFLPGGTFAHARFSDGLDAILDTADGSVVRRFVDDHYSEFSYQALSPSGRVLATQAEGDEIFFWDTRSGRRIGDLRQVFSGIGPHDAEMAFLGDGRIFATGDYGGLVRLWWLPTGESLGSVGCGGGDYRPLLATDPTARKLACATSEALVVRELVDRPATPAELIPEP